MSAQKTALITGVTGQDVAYLAELLLDEAAKAHENLVRTHQSKTRELARDRFRANLRAALAK
ncbi:MAG: hypothetical protein HKN78_08840 [Sphingomonadaceae bacterium]|nr:hypothetical protein [Sphingomonadaceae bacterium]